MSEDGEWRSAQRGAVPLSAKSDPFAARPPYGGKRGADVAGKPITNDVIPPAPRPARRPLPRPELDAPLPAVPVEASPAPVAPSAPTERPRWKETLQHLVRLSAWWPAVASTPAREIVTELLSRQQAFEALTSRVLEQLEVEATAPNRLLVSQSLMALYAHANVPEESELLVALKTLQALTLPAPEAIDPAPLETLVSARVALFQLAIQLDQLWGHVQWPQSAASTSGMVTAVATIARELTVAWCQQQGITDRNRVYREALSLAAQAAYAECARRWWEGLRPSIRVRPESLWEDMPGVRTALRDMHMGHGAEDELFNALLARLLQAICRQAVRYPAPSGWGFYQQEEWRATVYRVLTDMMGAAWREAAKEVRLRAEAMSPEELAAWMQTEGAAPMPVAPVLEGFERKAGAWGGPCTVMHLDLATGVQAVRERLTMLWGVSDALSKAR